jgi:hypothetical protein
MKKLFVLIVLMFMASLAMAQRGVVPPQTGRGGVQYRPYYPSYGYGGYYGGYYRSVITGIKFNLDLVPKNELALVKKGIVSIDGAEIGIVNRHDGWWNGSIPVSDGDHEVIVELEDGRVFRTQIFVQPGQILHVYLRFKQ